MTIGHSVKVGDTLHWIRRDGSIQEIHFVTGMDDHRIFTLTTHDSKRHPFRHSFVEEYLGGPQGCVSSHWVHYPVHTELLYDPNQQPDQEDDL